MKERYKQFKEFLNEEPRTVGEAYRKLHELYDENKEEDIKELTKDGTKDDLYVFFH